MFKPKTLTHIKKYKMHRLSNQNIELISKIHALSGRSISMILSFAKLISSKRGLLVNDLIL